MREVSIVEPDRDRVARHAGALDQIPQLRLRALDEEPVSTYSINARYGFPAAMLVKKNMSPRRDSSFHAFEMRKIACRSCR